METSISEPDLMAERIGDGVTSEPDFTEGRFVGYVDDNSESVEEVPTVPSGMYVPNGKLLGFLKGETPIDSLVNMIDDVRDKLTDKEYIDLMDIAKKINDTRFYELTLVVVKLRPPDENNDSCNIIGRIHPVIEKRIYKPQDFKYKNEKDIMSLKNKYLNLNSKGFKICVDNEFEYYDNYSSPDTLLFKKYLCINVKKL